METLLALLALSLAWLLAVMTPGPNFVVTSQAAAGRSRREALWIALGVSLAAGGWAAASMAGLGLLLSQAGWLAGAIKWAGAAYLVFLGVKTIRNAGRAIRRAAPATAGGAWRALRLGLLTSLSNPKTAAFFASLFVLVLPPAPPPGLEVLIVALVVAISLLWYGLVAWLFSRPAVRGWHARFRRWIERAVGGLLIGLGVRLAADR